MVLSSPNREEVFDEIRQLWVKATPEEIVRQQLLFQMINHLGYPKDLIAVEKKIKEIAFHSQAPNRRVDLLCFRKEQSTLHPLLLVECKDEPLSQKAVEQVIGYNYFVKSSFIAVVNLTEVRLGFFDLKEKRYIFQNGLPSYDQLLNNLTRVNV